MTQNGQPRESRNPEDPTWRILAEEASQEADPEKLMGIISALLALLTKIRTGEIGGS